MAFESDKELVEDLIEVLEANGMVSITDGQKEVSIQSIDDKEGYSYISSTNREFDDSKEAVKWAVEQFSSTDNITNWE